MEKYTDLNEVLRDPSLAIITDNMATQSELNRIYVRYKVLPKRQRRFCNYYSNKFFGRSVTEMYFLQKSRLRAESDVFGDLQQLNEKYAVSEPDLYYKVDRFNSGDINLCFILGHSGSGKSVMARTLEGDDIDHIELDDMLLIKDHFTMEELKGYSDMFWSFFAGEGKKYYISAEERNTIPKEEYEDKVFIDFVHFAMDYAAQHREKKYLIDGIWIYLYFDDPSVFADYTVLIKGTSFLKSKSRAMKREMHRDREELQNRKQMFGREVRNYLLDEDKIDAFRKYYADKPETEFRAEEDEAEKAREEAVKELNSIDSCFVDGDAEGIRAILKKAEADPKLSTWNRLRIINECNSALLELHLQ